MNSNRQSFGCFGGGLNRPAVPNFGWAAAGQISNRHFIVRLKTSVTSTKHTAEYVSNRNISEGGVEISQSFPEPQKIDSFTCRNFFGSLRKSPRSRRRSAVAPVRLSYRAGSVMSLPAVPVLELSLAVASRTWAVASFILL